MYQSFSKPIRILLISLATFSLFACGGGGASSTGASSSTPFSSSLVVEVSDPSQFAGSMPERTSATTIASLLSATLVSTAYAQTAGIPIYIDNQLSAETDASGTAVIPIQHGTYNVCIGDPLTHCTTVTVEPDSVVVVNGDTLTTSVERAQDHIVQFQEPVQSHKTLVCHKGQTLSVGTPAAQKGHHAHGDALGACAGDAYVARAEEIEEEEEEEDDGAGKAEKDKSDKRNSNSGKKPG